MSVSLSSEEEAAATTTTLPPNKKSEANTPVLAAGPLLTTCLCWGVEVGRRE